MMTVNVEEQAIGAAPLTMAEENGGRAALYGVLAHLFIGSPSTELLHSIADSEHLLADDGSPLASEWRALREAARGVDAEVVRGEYDEVFVGTGRPLVSLYASSYMSGQQSGQLLAELRSDLVQIGYARAEESTEYEDHLSALCDVMRGLVADEAESANGFEKQKVFFQNYLAPWYGRVCETICNTEQVIFYRSVAKFINVFFTNEAEYFELA